MVKAKHKVVNDDIVYLVEVIERIQRMSELGESSDIKECMACIQRVSNRIKSFLEKALTAS